MPPREPKNLAKPEERAKPFFPPAAVNGDLGPTPHNVNRENAVTPHFPQGTALRGPESAI